MNTFWYDQLFTNYFKTNGRRIEMEVNLKNLHIRRYVRKNGTIDKILISLIDDEAVGRDGVGVIDK